MDYADTDFAFERLPGNELHACLREFQQSAPVHPCTFGGIPSVLITGHPELAEAFRDNDLFPPANAYRITIEPVQGLTFQTMEGDQHHLYRKLATPAFRSKAVEKMEVEGLSNIAHQLIDNMPVHSCDFAQYFSHRYSFLVISRMLGIPMDREEEFRGWASGFLAFSRDAAHAKFCARQISEYMLPILAERRADPRADIISDLTQADAEGVRLTDEDILSNVRLLFAAGATTTTDAIGNLIYALLADPVLWEQLKANPDARANAIEELLRWETPVSILPRVSAMHPIYFHGVEIPANSFCLFAIAAANRDTRVFDNGDHFDITRDSSRKLLSFGPGPRLCPGMHLARKQLSVVLDVLIERLPDLRLRNPDSAIPCGTVLRGPEKIYVSY